MASKKQFKFVPIVAPAFASQEVITELGDKSKDIHQEGSVVGLDWDDKNDFPHFKKWLIEIYGKDAKKYDEYALRAT